MKHLQKKFVIMQLIILRKFYLIWDGSQKKTDKHTDALLRSFVISALGKMNDDETTEEALKRYSKFLKSPNSISPDLIEAYLFYCCMEWRF